MSPIQNKNWFMGLFIVLSFYSLWLPLESWRQILSTGTYLRPWEPTVTELGRGRQTLKYQNTLNLNKSSYLTLQGVRPRAKVWDGYHCKDEVRSYPQVLLSHLALSNGCSVQSFSHFLTEKLFFVWNWNSGSSHEAAPLPPQQMTSRLITKINLSLVL